MAKPSIRSVVLVGACTLLPVISTCYLFRGCPGRVSERATQHQGSAERCWQTLCDSSENMQVRIDAATRLASLGDQPVWLVLFLTSPSVIQKGASSPTQPEDRFDEQMGREIEVKSLIAALAEMKEGTNPAVLLAATCRLQDDRTARLSESTGLLFGRTTSDGTTPPVRECARQALIRCIGKDCAYDVARWRQLILEMSQRKRG
jgi:hypothetical protein